jgi:predicted metal-dependent enzyme (double-stranded beta helix superfamily)
MVTELVKVDEAPKQMAQMSSLEKIDRAREYAVAVQSVIAAAPEQFVSRIGKNDFPKVEVWQTVAWMDGAEAHTVWVRNVYGRGSDDEGEVVGFEARAEVHDIATGKFIGAAESYYGMDESATQGQRNHGGKLNSAKSAAQTRALSKALRGRYAFVAVLAGLEPTPAEEMGSVTVDKSTGEIQEPESRAKSPSKSSVEQLSPEGSPAFIQQFQDRAVAYAVKQGLFNDRNALEKFVGKEDWDNLKTLDDFHGLKAMLDALLDGQSEGPAPQGGGEAEGEVGSDEG